MADISNIVNVNISIDTPVSDGASFSNILLVTPVGTGTGSSNACYYITSADDLVSHGYTSSDPVYQAATVAFAQDQIARPNRVYVVGQDSTVTEGVTVEFADDAIDEIANLAYLMNEETENIGARRLHTILEILLEDVSFNLPDPSLKEIKIDRAYVQERLREKIKEVDVDKYIL